MTKVPLFQGSDEGNQLFAIYKMLGSPTEEEYQKLSSLVPYDPKLFKDFPKYKRNISGFMGQFYNFEDKENL